MSEERYDLLTREWRVFSPHRQERTFLPQRDECPLCPATDPDRPTEVPAGTRSVHVFPNRFPAFLPTPGATSLVGTDLSPARPAVGAAEVVVYTPHHDLSLAEMSVAEIAQVIEVWTDRYRELGSRDEVGYVYIFENKGEVVGVTLHHPHGQIYGFPQTPPLPARELAAATAHRETTGRCLHCDLLAAELRDGRRLLVVDDAWAAYVPFAARMPFEMHIAPRRHVSSLLELTDAERTALAGLLKQMLTGYDALFGFSLPYIMAMHQAPTDGGKWSGIAHLHLEFTPVYRTATKLKYLAGAEMGAGAFISDMLPEQAAATLRSTLSGAERRGGSSNGVASKADLGAAAVPCDARDRSPA
jgi:UDPglucose--hexose-1-phosphate uridylyltransferase